MKGADELSEDAVACIKRIVAEYDAQASEKKYALTKIVHKKNIEDKDWVIVISLEDLLGKNKR